jgi:hypothetical protein
VHLVGVDSVPKGHSAYGRHAVAEAVIHGKAFGVEKRQFTLFRIRGEWFYGSAVYDLRFILTGRDGNKTQ